MSRVPGYRSRKGSSRALVTLTDSVTGERRDYWLGPVGSSESREAYHRLIAEWESLGRRLPAAMVRRRNGPAADGPRVSDLIFRFWLAEKAGYKPKRASAVRATLRLLRRMDGSTPTAAYGPPRLWLLREAMIAGDPGADPPRRRWSRRTVNDRGRTPRCSALGFRAIAVGG